VLDLVAIDPQNGGGIYSEAASLTFIGPSLDSEAASTQYFSNNFAVRETAPGFTSVACASFSLAAFSDL
jgi:hypothetical protein